MSKKDSMERYLLSKIDIMVHSKFYRDRAAVYRIDQNPEIKIQDDVAVAIEERDNKLVSKIVYINI